jgi:hypothetical protein
LGDDGTCELETPRRSIRVDVNEIRSVHSSPETDGGRESYTIKYRGQRRRRSTLTGVGGCENVSPSKPGKREVGGLRLSGRVLQVDAELAQFDDRGPAPADRVG